MFSFLRKKTHHQAQVNQYTVEVNSKETLLVSALNQGVAMAHSCRVGGCGTCKCRLVEGKTRSLTDFSYVLSAEELADNYILACQSVPLSDIKVEARLTDDQAPQTIQGTVAAQQMLTHDICQLTVRLAEPLEYKAGQYTELALASLPTVFRNFSFAGQSGQQEVHFFIRRVAKGVLTEKITRDNLVGEEVTLRGPHGDFWLQPSDAPILMVAGGSGLAPIMAILKEAQAQGLNRPVTLLFGARRQHDLYLLEEIEHMASHWPAQFTFIPVLSEAGDEDWQGQRGLVTEHIAAVLTTDMHAYLCGPPVMVDAASDVLAAQGIRPEHIHADRFLTNTTAVAS